MNDSLSRIIAVVGIALVGVIGTLVAVSPRVPVDAVAPEVGVVPVVPERVLETRVGPGFVTGDGLFEGVGRVRSRVVFELLVAGRGGVDVDASAVFLNVTAVGPSGGGYVTVFPCGPGDPPFASSVNFSGGDVAPNAVLSKVGVGGRVCFFSTAETDLIVDVNGFVPAETVVTTTTVEPATTTTMVPSTSTTSSTTTTTTTTTAPSTSTTSSTTTSSSTTSSSTTTTIPVSPSTLVGPSTTLPPSSSPTTGDYKITTIFHTPANGSAPARWNPCEPIRYLVNIDRASSDQIQDLNDAVAAIETATAIDFVFVGLTSDGEDKVVPPGADAVLVFSDQDSSPDLDGTKIGVGGSDIVANIVEGVPYARRLQGFVLVDSAVNQGDRMLALWLHELGHMIGLDHVGDPNEKMYPIENPRLDYGPGDLEGLWNLGLAAGCIPDF